MLAFGRTLIYVVEIEIEIETAGRMGKTIFICALFCELTYRGLVSVRPVDGFSRMMALWLKRPEHVSGAGWERKTERSGPKIEWAGAER